MATTNFKPTTPAAKLTDHEIDLIRELIQNGLTGKQLAAKFDRMVERRQGVKRSKQ